AGTQISGAPARSLSAPRSAIAPTVPSSASDGSSPGLRPLVDLYARNQDGLAVRVGLEDGRLPFLDLEPLLTQRIDDVRLVRDDQSVRARVGYCAQKDSKRLRSAVVLVGTDHEAPFGYIRRRLRLLATDQPSRLDGPMELARIRLADRDTGRPEDFADHLCLHSALVVQLALLRDVLGMPGIGVRLIWMRGTVAKHDDVSARAQRLQKIDGWSGRLSPREPGGDHGNQQGQASNNGPHIIPPFGSHRPSRHDTHIQKRRSSSAGTTRSDYGSVIS